MNSHTPETNGKKLTPGRILKYSSVSIFLLLLILATIPFLIPMDSYREEIESQLSSLTDNGVSIKKLRIHLLPLPTIKITGIHIEDGNSKNTIAVESAIARLSIKALLHKQIAIPSITFTGITGSIPLLTKIVDTFSNTDSSSDDVNVSGIRIQQILFEKVTLITQPGQALGPYNLELFLDRHGDLASIIAYREDKRLQIHAAPIDDHMFVTIEARDWTLPVGKPLHIEKLDSHAEWKGETVRITKLLYNGYGGKIEGNATVSWENEWKIETPLSTNNIQLEPLLTALDNRTLSGTLNSSCQVRLQAHNPEDLLEKPCIKCDFNIENGELYKADLEQASKLSASQEEISEGTTPFERMQGNVNLKNGNIRFTKLTVTSPNLQATGSIHISPDKSLNGEIEVSVKRTAGIVSVPLNISGNTESPSIKPTRSAMAGGAVGTAILGPGLGTAIGIKAGNAIKKITGFFSGNQDSDDNASIANENIGHEEYNYPH